MATSDGLVVPNIKNVQRRPIIDIAKELNRLRNLAYLNNFSEFDLKDGTITISNIGSIGGIYGFPLVSTPELAIVALGQIQQVK